MKKLYKFCWNCGRMGNLNAIFVSDDEEVNKTMGKHVYFGEVLGKHSEIYGTLKEKDFIVLTDEQDFISKFEKFDCATGLNPLDYLSDDSGN